MRRYLIYLLLLAATVSEAKSPSLISPLQNQNVDESCGCTLSDESSQTYLWNNLESKSAMFCIHGKDVKAPLIFTDASPERGNKGDRYTERYRWKDTLIEIQYEITSVCAKDDEHCEITKLKALLKAQEGVHAQSVSLNGSCGC